MRHEITQAEDDAWDDVDRLLLPCLERPESEWSHSVEQLCESHPEHAATIRERMAAIRAFGGDSLAAGPVEASLPSSGPERRFGDFRLLRVLGGGGMGIVYLAQQQSMNRQVALKLVRPELLDMAGARQRFQREVEAASQIDDPGICTVFEAGTVDDTPYIAMRYIDGVTLASWLRERGEGTADSSSTGSGDVSARRPGSSAGSGSGGQRQRIHTVVQIVERLCRSVHNAHEHGLIHRDIKPSNIMLTADLRPVLLDFGLARSTDGGSKLTLSGEVLGTPAYMSPEQISPGRHPIDRRADVYSLGATLFECLTLRPPFQGENRQALYRNVLEGALTDCTRYDRSIPADLRVVVEKALDRDPDRRYDTAAELAEDLRRVRHYEPIKARRAGVALRLRRWTQRNPVPAAFLLCLVAGLAIALYLLAEVRFEERARAALALVGAAEKERLYHPDWSLRLALAAEVVRPLSVQDPRIASQVHTALVEAREIASYGPAVDPIHSIEFSADGRHVLAVENFTAMIVGPGTADPTRLEPPSWTPSRQSDPADRRRREFAAAHFAPNGETVVTAGRDGFARVWNLRGEQLLSLPVSETAENSDARYLDDDRIVTISGDGWIRTWNARTGTPTATRIDCGKPLIALGIVPRSSLLIAGTKGAVQLWDLKTGTSPFPPVTHGGGFKQTFAFSSEAPLIGIAPRLAPGIVWNHETGEFTRLGDSPGRSIAFVGDRVVTVAADYLARIFDHQARAVRVARHPCNVINRVAAIPGSELFVTLGNDGTARVFDLQGREIDQMVPHLSWGTGLAVSPSGDRLATGGTDARLRICRLRDEAFPQLHGHATTVLAIRCHEDRILTASFYGWVLLWQASPGRAGHTEYRLLKRIPHKATVECVEFFADGSFVTGNMDGFLRFFEPDGTERVDQRHSLRDSVLSMAVIPSRAEVIVLLGKPDRPVLRCCRSGDEWHCERMQLADGSGKELERRARRVCISADGRYLLVACSDRTARIFDLDGRLLFELPKVHGDFVESVAMSGDGHLIVTGSGDGSGILWDVAGRSEIARLEGHDSQVNAVRFSPDDQILATCGLDGVARLWDRSGRLLLRCENRRGPLKDVGFSRDGRRLFTVGADPAIRSWCVDVEELLSIAFRRAGPFSATELARYGDVLGNAVEGFDRRRGDANGSASDRSP